MLMPGLEVKQIPVRPSRASLAEASPLDTALAVTPSCWTAESEPAKPRLDPHLPMPRSLMDLYE